MIKNNKKTQNHDIVVLIDAENTRIDSVKPILDEIARYGIISVLRAYGNWKNESLKHWEGEIIKDNIKPVQCFNTAAKKNSVDIQMVIEGMDLLYKNQYSLFCIISSDADFTKLSRRIREDGVLVYGFGERKRTSDKIISAFNKFIFTEILEEPIVKNTNNNNSSNTITKQAPESKQISKLDQGTQEKLLDIFNKIKNEGGFVHLGPFGVKINNLIPEFDSRNYGFSILSDLIKSIEFFDVILQKNGTAKVFYIKYDCPYCQEHFGTTKLLKDHIAKCKEKIKAINIEG